MSSLIVGAELVWEVSLSCLSDYTLCEFPCLIVIIKFPYIEFYFFKFDGKRFGLQFCHVFKRTELGWRVSVKTG